MGLQAPKSSVPKGPVWEWTPREALKATAAWTVVHSVALQVTRALVDNTLQTAGESPRHTYMQGMVVQVLIAPLMALSYVIWRRRHRCASLRQWLNASMFAPHAWPSRLFFYNIMAHFLKDMGTAMPPLIFAHHVVCIFVLTLQARVLVVSTNSCLLGCAFFELGSAAYNVVKLYPSCEGCGWFYLGVMTLSNASAVLAMTEWVKQAERGKVFGAVVTLGLALARQQVAITDVLFPKAVLPSALDELGRS